MPDSAKVIKGLETHLKEISVGKTCFECPYCGNNPCEIHLIADALVLLKKQPEQKHGHWIERDDYNDTYYKCSVCGEPWVLIDGTPLENGMHFCPKCGARMESEVKQGNV